MQALAIVDSMMSDSDDDVTDTRDADCVVLTYLSSGALAKMAKEQATKPPPCPVFTARQIKAATRAALARWARWAATREDAAMWLRFVATAIGLTVGPVATVGGMVGAIEGAGR
jgi:hypothetical protein